MMHTGDWVETALLDALEERAARLHVRLGLIPLDCNQDWRHQCLKIRNRHGMRLAITIRRPRDTNATNGG